jgi:FKBP-type peptidyl-prolyl cis-trans isomerase
MILALVLTQIVRTMMNGLHSKFIVAAVLAGLTLGMGSVSSSAQTSDARVTAAEARADAAEKRAQAAEERAAAAEKRARLAEERARAAEARAEAAVKHAKARPARKKSKSPTVSSSGLSRSEIERLERKQYQERLIRSRRRD